MLYKSNNYKKILTVDDVKYEYDSGPEYANKERVRGILLFSNIYTIQFRKESGGENSDKPIHKIRFPFKLYNTEKWDIEHVSSRHIVENIASIKGIDRGMFFNLMKRLYQDITDKNDRESIKKFIEEENRHKTTDYQKNPYYNLCCSIWQQYAVRANTMPDNNLENLVLLNYSINRSYGDAFFNEKRSVIIKNDRDGVFIPICTKNVFTKYYSESIKNPTQWTDEDKEKYKKVLEEMFAVIEEWK